jgi:hypothetical protein
MHHNYLRQRTSPRTCAYTHTHKHTHARAHSDTDTHTHTHARALRHRHTQTHTLTHARAHSDTDTHTHLHTHAHTHTHTHTHTQCVHEYVSPRVSKDKTKSRTCSNAAMQIPRTVLLDQLQAVPFCNFDLPVSQKYRACRRHEALEESSMYVSWIKYCEQNELLIENSSRAVTTKTCFLSPDINY